MGSIVIVTSEMTGRINIATELAKRLRAQGHETWIGGAADEVEALVEAREGPYVDLAPAARPAVISPPAATPVARLRRLRTAVEPSVRKENARDAVARLQLDRFVAALQRLEPELVLVDLELTEHLLATLAAGLPTGAWTSMMSVVKRPGLPPLGSSTVPGRGAAGTKSSIEAEWIRLRVERKALALRQRVTRAGRDRRSVLRRVAADRGLDFDEHFDVSQWLKPAVPRNLPVVTFNLWELEHPHVRTPNWHYVGPLVGPRPSDTNAGALLDLARRRASGATDAILYCSFGAWDKGAQAPFLRLVIEAVRHRPRWELVVGLGKRNATNDFSDVPANVHLFDWAPQTAALAMSDAALHHAGISSVNECLIASVPMVVYPYDYLDQPGNAARVAAHGIGVRGDRDDDGPDAIARNIDMVLTGPFRARIEPFARAALRHDKEQTAVATIANLASSRP